MALEDRLREQGLDDDTIAAILADEDEEEDRIAKPRNLSDWKRRARLEEQQRREAQAKLAQYELRDSFEQARAELPDEMRSLVTFDDVRGEPKITPALLKVKVQETQERQQAAMREQARQFGFEDPQVFQQALQRFAQQAQQEAGREQQNRQNLAAATSMTFQGQPATAPVLGRQEVESAARTAGTVEEVLAAFQQNRDAFVQRMERE